MQARTFALIVKKVEPIRATCDAETKTAFEILLTTGGNMVSRSAAEALAFAYLVEAGERRKLLKLVSRGVRAAAALPCLRRRGRRQSAVRAFHKFGKGIGQRRCVRWRALPLLAPLFANSPNSSLIAWQ